MPGHYLDFEPPHWPGASEREYDTVRQRCDREYKLRRDDLLTAREALKIADEIDVRLALLGELRSDV